MKTIHGLFLVAIELKLICFDAILENFTAGLRVVIQASIVAAKAVAAINKLLEI